MNIFLYGSLMYEAVWSRVVKGRYAVHYARLTGWRRLSIKGEDYPAALPGNGIIEGIVRVGISEADLVRLDRFEGDEYTRVLCTPETQAIAKLEAFIYQFNDVSDHRLLTSEWNQTEFEKNGLNRFLARYSGFNNIKSDS
jgi:gamma-glutamylcyclotransferase (GGCT)/AIG2-like uncharacterized protein YtfP